MYQFKDNNNQFYHEQKFTLQWDFPEARWVFVRYVNGNKRVILPIITDSSKQVVDGAEYKILNFLFWLTRKKIRSYRYRRLFLRQAKDEFSNIANFQSQKVKLLIISSQFPWLKSLTVPMSVSLFRLKENKMNVHHENVYLTKQSIDVHNENPKIVRLNLDVREMDMRFNALSHSFETVGTSLDYSIEMLIENKKINKETDLNNILSTIN